MYYSYKPVVKAGDPYELLEFIPQQVRVVEESSGLDIIAGTKKETVELISDQDAFTFLGYVKTEGGTFGYYHVADGVTPVEQPAEINAQQLDVLPTEVANELALNGEFAQHQRFLGGIKTMPLHTNYNDEHNYAALQAQITDLTTVLGALLAAEPSALALDEGTLLRIRDTIKRNSSINNGIKEALAKVGL